MARDSSRFFKSEKNKTKQNKQATTQNSSRFHPREFHPFLKVLLQYLAINQEAPVSRPACNASLCVTWTELPPVSLSVQWVLRAWLFIPTSLSWLNFLVAGFEVWKVWGDAFLLFLHSANVVLGFWSPPGPWLLFLAYQFWSTVVSLSPIEGRQAGDQLHGLHVTLRSAGVQLESASWGTEG